MGRLFSVKLLLAAALTFTSLCRADDPPPDARELLKAVRDAQTEQQWKFTGSLRVGRTKYPLRLEIEKGSIRYEFTDNGDALTLRLGEKGTTLEERKGGKTARITPAKFDDKVRDTDLSYEDLALRFLYWNDAKVIGSDIIHTQGCWKVELRPPAKSDSQYSRVVLWIGKNDGALMKAESYDANGKWQRRFRVNKAMKRDGYWLLKELLIETASFRGTDPKPTYLVLDDASK